MARCRSLCIGADPRLSGLRGHLFKGTVAAIAKELVRLPIVGLWPAVVLCPCQGEAGPVEGNINGYIVSYEQVEPVVAVVIEKRSADTPTGVVGSGFCGHVGKGAVTVVLQHLVAAKVGDVEVDPPIIIVVAARNAHPVPVGLQARL